MPESSWPPAPLVDLLPRFQQWSAWYSGEIDQLTSAYGSDAVSAVVNRPIQYAAGFKGWVGRIIWGNPVAEGQQDDRLHVPLAADLCAAASELCYSDPPQITADSDAAQERVQEYIAAGLFTSATTGLEIGQALGGHYKQAVLDAGDPRSTLETIAYDGAWPTFRRGRLVEVTFWWELPSTTLDVWRHFESHDVDNNGIGVIRHALFKGTRNKVGSRESLQARPETTTLTYPGVLEAGDLYSTGTPGLDVVHTPAREPQRLWRTHPLGMHLGRSVLQGQEPVLSQLDNVYTSWMRDVDLARSRLVVADWLLDTRTGPTGLTQGMGKSFDLDRKLITPLAIPQAVGGNEGMDPIKMVQFAIRVNEHRETCQELTEIVLRAASYSAQTFGEDENGNAQTATGVLSKDSRSMRTRRAILGPEADGLKYIVEKMLAMDQAGNRGPVAGTVTVTFPEGAEESPLQLAQTLQAVRGAQAASNETIVRMFHPDWTDDQVSIELRKMQDDLSASMTFDATTSTSFPPDTGPNPLTTQ